MDKVATKHRHKNSEMAKDAGLLADYITARKTTEELCRPLEPDDYLVQTMPDVSPAKWHIAHVSWFFETFLLQPYLTQYQCFHPQFAHIFNSYYEMVGSFHPRPQRGLLNRPTLEQVYAYRAHVDQHMQRLLQRTEHPEWDTIAFRTRVGINHEQQHQELLLTDIKHIFATNPLFPAYHEYSPAQIDGIPALQWQTYKGGLVSIGHPGNAFCYDNETPSHQTYLRPFRLATRLITNGEYLEFMHDSGYERPELWLSDAWAAVKSRHWQAPLYWQQRDGEWWQMTLHGMHRVDPFVPVCHVSFYEADAFARWKGKRLPTEAEWEIAAYDLPIQGNFRDDGRLHPQAAGKKTGMQQLFGDVWEWTSSPYTAYPGYTPLSGALGEYNGKFMCNQIVLRGGSCVSPANHIRATYRNFFYPKDQWQFSGFRLAEDAA